MNNFFDNLGNPNALATVNDSGITAQVLNVPVMRKGVLTNIRVSNAVLVQTGVDLYQYDAMENKSVMASAITIGRIDREAVLKAGFKSIAEYAHGIVPTLSDNEINSRRRVALLFGALKEEGFHWRAMVGDEVTTSNLEVVTRHFFRTADGKPIDFEKLTEDELTKMYADFMIEYVQSGKIDLHASQAKLRDSIKDLDKVVAEVKAEDITDQSADQSADQSESKYESALHCIRSLEVLLGTSDKKVATALQTLIKAVETLK